MSQDLYVKPKDGDFKSYSEFYTFYLSEHSKPLTKLFHFMGTTGVLVCWGLLAYQCIMKYAVDKASAQNPNWWLLGLALLIGYGLAWFSHFCIEKNKPATFKYPLWSFIGDFVMYYEILLCRHRVIP